MRCELCLQKFKFRFFFFGNWSYVKLLVNFIFLVKNEDFVYPAKKKVGMDDGAIIRGEEHLRRQQESAKYNNLLTRDPYLDYILSTSKIFFPKNFLNEISLFFSDRWRFHLRNQETRGSKLWSCCTSVWIDGDRRGVKRQTNSWNQKRDFRTNSKRVSYTSFIFLMEKLYF